jgi:1-acyl-sn-glycerol-3-phosphate acyltransferase
MLTERFYRDYRVLPAPAWAQFARTVFTSNVRLARTQFRVEGWDTLPDRPVLFATNSTQKNDFMGFRYVADRAGRLCVSVTKAKNYHSPIMSLFLRRLGVIPIASKGYFLLLDFTQQLGRRPTDAEYRAMRDHLDHDAPLPTGAPFEELARTAHTLLERRFEPAATPWRDFQLGLYRDALAETLRLSREAVAAGADIQMYPEGTVAPRLGRGRHGAVQLAWALGLPIVPVGMSGCPEAYAGNSPLLRLRGGDITLRFGAALELPADLLPRDFRPFEPEDERRHRDTLQGFVDDRLMPALDALLDPKYRRQPGDPFVGKGTRAFL